MRVRDIILFLKDYIVLGIVLLIFIGILFYIGYKIIYQKLMKGKKRISKKKILLYGISICYFAVVFGAVFLNRVAVYKEINLHLLSSYLEAYHNMSPSLIRNIILNILLFIPLGIFLPLYTNKLDKIYKVVPIGFIITLIIEIMQYKTGFGIFEIADLLNNTIGVLIGYGLYKSYINIKNKEKKIYLIGYLSPIYILVIIILTIGIIYQNQELGNLPFEYNYKLDMTKTNIINNVEFSDIKEIKPIYYLKSLKESETRKQANEFYKKLGTTVREEDIEMYIYDDTAIYNSKDGNYNMWINYADGSYHFTDYSSHDRNIETKSGATKEEIVSALSKIGIMIPTESVFEELNGNYIFKVNIKTEENLIEGTLNCSYYNDNTIKRVENNIVKYKKVKEKEIISEKDAYNEVVNGKFQYGRFLGNIDELVIEKIELKYYLDTKGYYVPIYVFTAKLNNNPYQILIKAVK